MKRLTERFSNGTAAVFGCGENCKYNYLHCHDGNCPTMAEIYEKLAQYEEADEKGLIVIKTEVECKPLTEDLVKHPAHYCFSKYEPKDVIRAWGLNFNRGNAIKYIARASKKNNELEDLKKARQYLIFEIEAMEQELLSQKEEVWKVIEEPILHGEYEVSNFGRVRSVYRDAHTWRGGEFKREGVILKHKVNKLGYHRVVLSSKNKQITRQVHRLVAEAFLPKPFKDAIVNHIDENPNNNAVSNLEWCDAVYNNNYGLKNQKQSDTKSSNVYQYTIDGEFVKKYKNAKKAALELGYAQSSITHACNGRLKTYKGYKWSYTKI